VIYVYAAGITLAITAAIVLLPIWRRGGRQSLTASTPWTIPLFVGLLGVLFLLSVLLQMPSREAVVVVLSVGSAIFAAYWLTRVPDGRGSLPLRAVLSAAMVLSLAITVVVFLGGLR
jgi:hypothetical protein